MQHPWLAAALAGLTLSTACTRAPEDPADNSTAPDPTNAPVATEDASETPAQAPSASTPSDAELTAALEALTQALRRFSAEQRRVPSSLDELVTAGYLQHLPEAPEGQRFAINTARVQVVLAKR